ncbi:hypothetical protein ACFRFL_37450 [Streptomyces sp. NPDC056708]|uniref:hypothetical protein n=1 Tax=unclassified Streptomyces TaxID=2593676 RepID=UPI0036742FFF
MAQAPGRLVLDAYADTLRTCAEAEVQRNADPWTPPGWPLRRRGGSASWVVLRDSFASSMALAFEYSACRARTAAVH